MAAAWLGFWMFAIVLPFTAYLEWREERQLKRVLRKRGLTDIEANEYIGHLDES